MDVQKGNNGTRLAAAVDMGRMATFRNAKISGNNTGYTLPDFVFFPFRLHPERISVPPPSPSEIDQSLCDNTLIDRFFFALGRRKKPEAALIPHAGILC